MASLISGRNTAPLNAKQIERVTTTAYGFESEVVFRYAEHAETAFHVRTDPNTGADYGEVEFGPDIYPGPNIVNPNSAVGLDGAIAHELQHYHRWRDMLVLTNPQLLNLDEALTSLQAISRYQSRLKPDEIHKLVSDAIQRIGLYVATLQAPVA